MERAAAARRAQDEARAKLLANNMGQGKVRHQMYSITGLITNREQGEIVAGGKLVGLPSLHSLL